MFGIRQLFFFDSLRSDYTNFYEIFKFFAKFSNFWGSYPKKTSLLTNQITTPENALPCFQCAFVGHVRPHFVFFSLHSLDLSLSNKEKCALILNCI